MKIGHKLSLSFAVVLVLATLASFYALYSLKEAQELSQNLFEKPYVASTETMGIRRDLADIGRNINNAFLENNHTGYRTIILDDFESINKRIDTLHTCFSEEDNKISSVENSVVVLKQEYEKVYAVTQQKDYNPETTAIDPTIYIEAFKATEEGSTTLSEHAKTRGLEFNNKVQDTVSRARVISVILVLVAATAGIIICTYITKDLTKRISVLVVMANKMAKGDFDF